MCLCLFAGRYWQAEPAGNAATTSANSQPNCLEIKLTRLALRLTLSPRRTSNVPLSFCRAILASRTRRQRRHYPCEQPTQLLGNQIDAPCPPSYSVAAENVKCAFVFLPGDIGKPNPPATPPLPLRTANPTAWKSN